MEHAQLESLSNCKYMNRLTMGHTLTALIRYLCGMFGGVFEPVLFLIFLSFFVSELNCPILMTFRYYNNYFLQVILHKEPKHCGHGGEPWVLELVFTVQ